MNKGSLRLALSMLLVGVLLGGAVSAVAASSLLRRPRRQWVLFLEPGIQYDYGRSYMHQAGMKESLAYWEKLANERKILVAGQLRDKKGALILVPAETGRRALEKMARNDPAVIAQTVRYEIDEWLVKIEAPPPPDPFDTDLEEAEVPADGAE